MGTAIQLFQGALLGSWTGTDAAALLVSLAYIAVFSFIGIRFFRWESR